MATPKIRRTLPILVLAIKKYYSTELYNLKILATSTACWFLSWAQQFFFYHEFPLQCFDYKK